MNGGILLELVDAHLCHWLPHLGTNVSMSSCEQNWNSYSFVCNKMQNRLTLKRAKNFMYIYINSKLLQEQFGVNPTARYKETYVV